MAETASQQNALVKTRISQLRKMKKKPNNTMLSSMLEISPRVATMLAQIPRQG